MKKKLPGILVGILLVVTIVPLTSGNNLDTDRVIFLEIDETQNKVLTTDDIIGDIHVQCWKHIINDVFVKNDSILLHIDIKDGHILNYEKSWTNVDFALPDSSYRDFGPSDIFWKHLVIFPDKDDCTYFYTFDDLQDYPLVCWEVRHTDGTTIIYNVDGKQIGQGIPAPSKGFSLSGYNDASWPDPWILYRKNADSWFTRWCTSTTTSLSLPSISTISSHVSDSTVEYLYELAHGSEHCFQANSSGSYYYSSDVKSDMCNRQPMRFAFIGSCHGMTATGPDTFSYEFRKGQMTDTVTVGYDHMEENIFGWIISLEWQDYMFEKIDNGLTIKKSFDMATAQYPDIAISVVFVGDENLKILDSPRIDGPTLGNPSITYSFSIHPYSPDSDSVFYLVKWGDNTSTGWIGPYAADSDITVSHNWLEEGKYEIKVKAKDDIGKESNWSSPLEILIINDYEPPIINITNPKIGYLYFLGEQKRQTLLGGIVIIGEILVNCNVSDNVVIDKVELFIDNNLKYSDNDSFCWKWNEKAFGRCNLKVTAYDWVGNVDSYEITVWKFF